MSARAIASGSGGPAGSGTAVSVVIPAYAAERTIARAVGSVIAQSHQPHEVVVVNDGSRDRTRELVLDLQRTHGNILLIDQENTGVSGARNAGLRAATGSYVAFLDADDEWKPEHLAAFFAYRERTGNVDLYSCGKYGERAADLPAVEVHTKDSYLPRVLATGWGFNTSGLILRRDPLRPHAFRPGFSTGEDVDFVLRLLFDRGVELHIHNVHSVVCPSSGQAGLSNTALDKPNAILEFCRERAARLDAASAAAELELLERLVARTELSIIKSLLHHRQFARLKAFSAMQLRRSRSLRVRAWALLSLLACAGRASA